MFDAIGIIRQRLEKKDAPLLCFDKGSNSYVADGSALLQSINRLTTVDWLPKDGLPIRCSSHFFTILFCGGNGTVEIPDHHINCFARNILLVRDDSPFVVKPDKESEFIIAYYDKEIFNSSFNSKIADLPIIYDFFQLEDCHNEFLYFDCHKGKLFSPHLQSNLRNYAASGHYKPFNIKFD